MKQITIAKIGYNAPSQANWTYGIWLVSFVDKKQRAHGLQMPIMKR